MTITKTECIYLHGFASGPASIKATYISSYLSKLGMPVHLPDLNGDAFEELTLTGQMRIIESMFASMNPATNVLLIGSSMGGLLATMSASKHEQVKAIVLLAPGFGLSRRWDELVGAQELEQWRLSGQRAVYHHAHNCHRSLKYEFIKDAKSHQTDELLISVPALVIHGRVDEVVPLYESERFKQINRAHVELHILESDHGLIDVLPEITGLIGQFLGNHGLSTDLLS